MNGYSTLFTPGRIGQYTLKNRIIMPAMGMALADSERNVTQRLLDYYAARARGGAGLITPHFAAVSPDAALPSTMAIYDDSQIDNWRQLADAVHAAGAGLSVQLMHTGMIFLYSGFVPEGVTVKVPSVTTWMNGNFKYQELTAGEIEAYIEDFARAARRVKMAGADVVELHACHGCLVSTFMSPVTNRRKDDFGSSFANRARFARLIVERMREEVSDSFPIIVRMNASDDIEGGVTMEEAMAHAALMEEAGADALSVSSGLEFWTTLGIPCYPFPQGPMIPLAEKIKKAVSIPVIVAGKITPELAEQTLAEGRVDFIALGRPLLADPELPNKLREGSEDDLKRCIYCNNCLKSATDPGAGPMSCSVNPFLTRESRYPFSPTERAKNILVAGGGLAGMETAVYLAERGHKVTIHEKAAQLGGQWNIACASPGKESYKALFDYLRRQLMKHGVAVKLNVEVTRETVLRAAPDTVVIATGAVPISLPIPGVDKKHVVQGHDVLDGSAEARGRSVVVGGRFIGMEAAIMLAERGQEVSIVTRGGLGENGVKLEKFSFQTLANRLFELRVPLYLHARVVEIMDNSVIVMMDNEIYTVPADTVIMSVGMRSITSLTKELEGLGLQVYTVGDCVRPRDASLVSYEAAKLAPTI